MRFILLIGLILSPLLGPAQSKEDSLLALLEIMPESRYDTVYYQLLKETIGENVSKAINYAKLASFYATKNNNKEIEIRANLGLGVGYYRNTQIDSAEVFIDKAISLSNKYQISHRLAWIYGAKGDILFYKNKLEDAINSYFEAIKQTEKYNLQLERSAYYNQIGLIEIKLSNYKNALESFQKAYKIKQTNKIITRIQISRINIAICLFHLNRTEECQKILSELIKKCNECNECNECSLKGFNTELNMYMGLILMQKNKIDSGKYYLFKALDFINEFNKYKLTYLYRHIGELYKQSNIYDSAVCYYNKSIKESILNNNIQDYLAATKQLAVIYHQQGNFEQSTFYFEKALALDDSLQQLNQNERIRASYMDFEQYKTNQLLQAKETIISRNKQISIFLGVIVLLAFTTTGLIYKNASIRKKLNEKLSDRVFERTRELNIFLYRASHDLAGPVATIKGLLELIGSHQSWEETRPYIKQMNLTAEKLERVIKRLEEISQINVTRIDRQLMPIRPLIEESIRKVRNGSPVTPEILLKGKEEARLDRTLFTGILECLVENSYQNIDRREPQKSIIIEITNNDKLILTVSDMGSGIIKGQESKIFDLFFSGYDRSEHTGTGLYYAKVATERLGGTIVLKNERKPTVFEVQIPFS